MKKNTEKYNNSGQMNAQLIYVMQVEAKLLCVLVQITF